MILIVGGAGYIGSHVNKVLNEKGYETIIYDNLSYGHKEAVKWGRLIIGDLNDKDKLNSVFDTYNIEAVFHFAAFTYVGESVENPAKYYINNVSNTLNLLEVMRLHKVNYFVFSSTCAIFGEPKELPLTENMDKNPLSPYGSSKLMVEKILDDYEKAYGLHSVCLRYFNAAGASLDAEIGEMHNPETHLIPLVLDAALKRRESIKVFGTDYDTKDGSCIRDYVHVLDLADAHIKALEYMRENNISDRFNLGSEEGISVLEIINSVKRITKKDFEIIYTNRRDGDPARLIGSSEKAQRLLKWHPQYSDVDTIIKSAFCWHQKMKF